jgi:excisionase family DNA binding protein
MISHSAATAATLAPLDPRQRYTVEETIAYLRVSRGSVYRLIKDGALRTIRARKRVFVPGSEIARLSAIPNP